MAIHKKRTEGKVKDVNGVQEIYKWYVIECSKTNEHPLEYKEFAKIVKACNKKLVSLALEEAETIELPYRLGEIKIRKFERSFAQDKSRWPIDYDKTFKLGFTVYHDQAFVYKWSWVKRYARVSNQSCYKFTAMRDTKRLIPEILKTKKIDYFN